MSQPELRSFVVFSDLDGCLLNEDYSHQEAAPALARLRELKIPLVLVSSKTEAEMEPIARELKTDWPLVCENGGIVAWRGLPHADSSSDHTILGTSREQILELLAVLRTRFQFRSFETMGIEGIRERTGLSREQAERAARRKTAEPIVWDDSETNIIEFEQSILAAGLTLTRGGRFWHVAGETNKGRGLQSVLRAMSEQSGEPLRSVALGDSPIDTPMLEVADVAIVIPGPDGKQRIHPDNANTIVAPHPASRGWNEAIINWLDSMTAD